MTEQQQPTGGNQFTNEDATAALVDTVLVRINQQRLKLAKSQAGKLKRN
jgi:hypothetical protein